MVTSHLEVFKKYADVGQGKRIVSKPPGGPGGAGLKVGLNDLRGLFQTPRILQNDEKYPSHFKIFPSYLFQ